MNLRALTRGDAAVAGAAVLLLISSFIPFYEANTSNGRECSSQCSLTVWHSGFLTILATVFLTGIASAALILLARFQGAEAETRLIAGLKLRQWGVALAVLSGWAGLWSLFNNGGGYISAGEKQSSGRISYDPSDLVNHGFGAWLAFIAVLVLAGAAVATPLVPALQAPLLADRPAAPQGYAGAPAGYQAPGGPGVTQPLQYGYPGAPAGQGGAPAYGGQPQPGGYGYPTPGQPQDHQPAATTPMPTPASAAPAADFAPFWFAVPAPRQLASKDNPAGPPVGELVPGTWYLAVEQRGAALVAQLQDGSHGLLSDTSGIQRG
ncbi:DUF5336 domain-containing protein [Kitasatospora atroaurantiaca]|uniref:Uncharacterized protein n=1 Tax=Kitasatospora atroaurantiaca TaxID=285545 RepID=A0A561EML9_9ACTN|nr:DUF5336 domain-containing protein [Kitasatospora atroaurantiaca]TWE16819.1 hypothetical protein FB465_1811 [Kitasatospora atroaurantiaca]